MLDKKQKIILAVSAAVAAFFASGNLVATRLASRAPFQPLSIFGEVVSYVAGDYVEEVDEVKAMNGAIAGFIEGLDPECSYLDKNEVAAFDHDSTLLDSSPVTIAKRYGYGYVLDVEKGSAAAAAGLKPDDYIRAIDHTSTRDMGLYHIATRLVTRPSVELTVVRDSWRAEPVTLTIKNGPGPSIPPATVKRTADATIVEFHRIRAGAAAVLRKALHDGPAADHRRLVIDLRRCGGKDYDEAVTLVSTLVKGGEIAVRSGQSFKEEVFNAKESALVGSPPRTAVLIDGATSGAAEVVAASLKARGAARLFGARTYGAARQQRLFIMSDGTGLLLSIYEWMAPDKTVITGKGVQPDVEQKAKLAEEGGDPVMESAVNYLLVN